MSTSRLVVIGADAAGMSAASQARRRLGPSELQITVVDRGSDASYSACGIPYWIAGTVATAQDLVARTVAQHRQRNIDMRMRTEAISIDPVNSVLSVRDLGTGESSQLAYDDLLIATGATPVRPRIPGIDSSGVHVVHTLDDGAALRAALDAQPQHVVVVGAGYVGLEMAESLMVRGHSITLITAGPEPMDTIDPDMGSLVADAARQLGVRLRTSAELVAIDADSDGTVRGVTIRTSGGAEDIPADLVVLGLGVRPAADLAATAGIAIGATGGIQTDPLMRSLSHQHIWAAGDCVETIHRVSGAAVAIALGTHANKQGRVAGENIAGGSATFPGVVGTAATRIGDLEIARTGLSHRQGEAAGFLTAQTVVQSTTRAGYFPGAEEITVKLISETEAGRLLGAQIVGRAGSAKRIDVLATAIWNEMTVEQISELDLSYAPPFGPVWDPVLAAARKAVGERGQ